MAAMVISGRAVADADLEQKVSNSPNWAAQAGDYGNHRWSDLNEINVVNFGKVPVAWTLYGDPKTGETNINAPPVFKNKVITGRSGGEYGVRGRLITYDIKTGRKSCTGWSVGPDSDLLVAPAETMIWSDGRMAARGKDSSLKAWQGDQWKLGAGPPWGWYSYDPKLNLGYYGTGIPGTWNSAQRSGDHKWSMTIFAQDLDTAMAKWVYQTTPRDQWDCDGVNEMSVVGITIKGKKAPALLHLDRNGFGYTPNRETIGSKDQQSASARTGGSRGSEEGVVPCRPQTRVELDEIGAEGERARFRSEVSWLTYI